MSNQLFSAWLYLTQVRKDCELEWERYVELPFAPTGRITLLWEGDEEPNFTAHHIEYCVPDDVFWCFARDVNTNCSCTPEENCCVTDDEHMQWMLKAGWDLNCRRDGEDRLFKTSHTWGEAFKYATDVSAEDV